MAKAKGPAFSTDAHGTIGNALTFLNWKGIPRVRKHFKPRNPQSAGQQSNRDNIKFGVTAWRTISDFTKFLWEYVLAKKHLQMSAYNYFLSEYNTSRISLIDPTLYPPLNLISPYPVPTGLVSWWKYDEESGVTAQDSIDANNGTILEATHVDGKINKALLFDGNNDRVTVPHNLNLTFTTQNFSILAWIYPELISGDRNIVEKGSWQSDGYYLVIDNTGKIWLQISQTGAVQSTVSYADITANTWFHIAAVRDGNKAYIYINAIDRTQTQPTISNPQTNTRDLHIASYAGGYNFFKGIIDEVMIYNRALTQTEIAHNYNLT